MASGPKTSEKLNLSSSSKLTRRDVLKQMGLLAGGSTLMSGFLSEVFAADASRTIYKGSEDGVLVLDADGLGYWEILMFCCLQGLANRDTARIWFKRGNDHEGVTEKHVFLDWYKQYDHLTFETPNDPYEVFGSLDPLPFNGYVIVDPQAPVTINIAANYASIESVLPVTEDLLARDELPALDVTYDLRGPFKGVNFRNMDRVETYQWAYENQWPEANQTRVANLSTPDAGELSPATYQFYTSNIGRDYTIAEGGFFFDLSSAPSDAQERALKDRILSDMDALGFGIVFGWHTPRDSEHQHIAHLSKYGQLSPGASNDAPNFSFHSRVDVGDAVKRFRRRAQQGRTTGGVKQKIYLTFVLSDGDSLNHIVRNAHGGQWLFPERGNIPFGWEMQPLLAHIGPGILDYFQATATENDYFVASASGIGYIFPTFMPERKLNAYLMATKPYLQRTGMSTLSVLNDYRAVSREKKNLYAEVLGDDLSGIIQGYTRAPGAERLYGTIAGGTEADESSTRSRDGAMAWLSTALPIAHNDSLDFLHEVLTTLAERRPQRPLFVPIHVPRSYFTYPDINKLVQRLGAETFEAVGPDAFYTLFARARSNSVLVNPPEFFVPKSETLRNGKLNKVFVTLQNLSDEPAETTVTAKLTCAAWDEPLTSDVGFKLEGKKKTDLGFILSLRNRTGEGEGNLEYLINDGEPLVSVPVRFTKPLG